jgi:xylulokinase
MSLFLGLDVGTQGTKALLLDGDSGAVAGRGAAPHGLIAGLPEGAVEQDPQQWLDAARAASAQALAAAGRGAAARVAGVAVSGQQHGLVVLDGEERVVRPAKLWCDTSTAAEAEELSAALGRRVPVGYTASKILWLKRREPQRWAAVKRVLLPHDYLNLMLTGEATMEAGDASGTGLFDPVARRFDAAAIAAVDARLFELLPPLLPAGSPAGPLTDAGARLIGLRAGVPVATGSGDNMLSAIGSGATRPGVAVASLGTSGTVFSYSPRPVVDPAGLIAPFCDATGGWLPLLCVMNCTNVTEEVRAAFGAGAGGDHAEQLAALTDAAARVPPGCGGVLWLPYLQGERVPDLPRAAGALVGLRAGSLSPGMLFRAAIEGTTLNIGWGVERMRALGLPVSRVRVVGGGAQNALWRQILADVLAAPVERLAEAESAALGAALQAQWTVRRLQGERVSADDAATPAVRTTGEVTEPDAGRSAVYREAGQRFRELAAAHYGVRP